MAAQTHNHPEHVKKQSGVARNHTVKPEPVNSLLAAAQVAQAARALADPAPAIPTDVIALQRTAGNRATTGLIQAKLTVGAAHDRYEQETDRVAQQVTAMPGGQQPGVQRAEETEELQAKPLAATITPLVQRQPEEEEIQAKSLQRQPEEEEIQTKPLQRQPEEEELQTKRSQNKGSFTVDAETEQRLNTGKGTGSPLPIDVRAFMESRFGADLSEVRLHTDSNAEHLNRALSAQAFTHGKHIYLGAGKSDVTSANGRRLLAHELTHVIQQGAARPTRTAQGQQGRKSTRAAGVQQTAQTHEHLQRVLNPLEWWQKGKEAKGKSKEAETKKGKAATVIDALAGGLQGDQREEVGMAGLYAATMSGPENKEFKPMGKFSEFLDKDAPSGLMNATYAAQGAGQALSGLMDIGRGINQQHSGSRFQQHVGARKIEGGISNILGGGTSMGSGIEGLVGDTAKTMAKVGGENIPILDVVYNYTLAGLKGKETIEDALTAKAMKSHAGELEQKKRGALHNIPEFQTISDYHTRRLRREYIRTHKPRMMSLKQRRKFAQKGERQARQEFEQEYKQARQDVQVLEQKEKMGQQLTDTEQAQINAFKNKYQNYEGYRETQKTAKFIGRRKAESATVKGVETAGYALDATGTFTAGADFGATKAVGKGLKFGASGYRGVRTLGRRIAKVHRLRKAKNLLEYGGKRERGIGWGAKQFFFGNVDAQREKIQKGVDEPNKIDGQFYAPGKKIRGDYGGSNVQQRTPIRQQIAQQLESGVNGVGQKQSRWARIGALARVKNSAEYGGKKKRGRGWMLKQYITPGAVSGKSKEFRTALARGTTGKTMAMTPGKAVAARRLATTSGERRLEQFFKGMQNSNTDVQQENLRIYNRLAGGSMVGKLSQLHRGRATPEDIAKWGNETLAKKDKEAIKDLFEKETSL